ncbi:MAG TPA: S9 family peptidase [Candidatus Polarisedimenticolaceae bacterium]
MLRPLLVAALSVLPVVAAETSPTAVEIASLRSLGALALSPDGKLVAYTLTSPKFDPEAKPKDDSDTSGGWSKSTQLFLAPATGGRPRAMTAEGSDVSSPEFTPNGRSLAFLRKVDGKSKLHVLPVDFGEAAAIDTGKLEPASFAFSPDGSKVAFLAERPRSEDRKREEFLRGGATAWGRKWEPRRLWVVPVTGGDPVEAYAGPEHVVAFRWSPDGKRFALVLAASADPYEASNLAWVAIAPVDRSAAARRVSDEGANLGEVAFSPDGRYLAWEQGVGTLSLLNHLVVVEVDGSRRWNAAAKLDPTLMGFAWRGDSRSIVAHLAEKTRSRFVELAFDGSRVRDVPFQGIAGEPARVVVGAVHADRAGNVLLFPSSTYVQPANPTVFDLGSGAVRVPVDVNPETAAWPKGKLEVVSWKSPEGPTIEGVLLTSPIAKPGAPAPLMVMPHGGPDSVTTEGFSWWATFFAARGYTVFRPNYRGGVGYGLDFYAANRGRLGEIEFLDIESGVDALVAKGVADPKRLFYGGWSWGGYLTTWTIGHTSRYRAAVAGAAVVDTVVEYVTSDINHGVAAEWEYRGIPWKQLENFDRANPMRSLGKVVTPTLVIHGEADERVPFPNGQILWRALVDLGVETELWAYPREPHGFTEKAHVVHFLERWVEWYRRHDPAVSGSRGSSQ